MSKARTEAELTQQLTGDRTWRIQEISDLVDAVEKADPRLRQVLLRSLVAIAYAHWEGGVRFAARKYMEFISMRRHPYRELDRQFLRNYFLPRLAAVAQAGMNIEDRCKLIDEIISAGDKRFTKSNDELINTRANLNFDVFSDICLVCGVDASSFDKHATFIDVMLLKRRNSIAHGEETLVEPADLKVIADTTMELIRSFSDALENRIYLRTFRQVA